MILSAPQGAKTEIGLSPFQNHPLARHRRRLWAVARYLGNRALPLCGKIVAPFPPSTCSRSLVCRFAAGDPPSDSKRVADGPRLAEGDSNGVQQRPADQQPLAKPVATRRKSGFAQAGFSPAGRKRIAQCFNAGNSGSTRRPVPTGTTETLYCGSIFMPSLTGLNPCSAPGPALKRWAILFRPAGLKPAYAKPDLRPVAPLRRGTPI